MKPRYYDLQHIKEIPIGDYLHACGIEPAKRYNGYALYHAPYREDHKTCGMITAQTKVEASSTL